MSIVKRIAALTLASIAFAAPAGATVINFDNLAQTAMPGNSGVYSNFTYFYNATAAVGDFRFAATGSEYFIKSTYANNTDSGRFSWNGTDYLMSSAPVTMTKGNNSSFAVRSLDLSSWESYATSVTLLGTFANGGTVTRTITLDTTANALKSGGADFANFELVGFQGLRSLTFTSSGGYVAFDNISDTANASNAPSVVPEPGTLAVFGLGLAGLALLRRRKQK